MGKLDKLKERRRQINSNEEKIVVPKVQNTFNSIIDYSKYNLEQEDIETLKEKEYILITSTEEIKKNFAEQSKTLYEAQQIFTSKSIEQNFNEWFLELGFKKTYVYQAINIYKLYLNYNVKRIFDLPKDVTYKIAQKQNDFDKEEIIEILENDKPTEKLKELNKLKEEQENPALKVNLTKFIDMDETEQKEEIKTLKLSKKLKTQELSKKRYELKELKEEIEQLKEEIKKIKYIEEKMKEKMQKI